MGWNPRLRLLRAPELGLPVLLVVPLLPHEAPCPCGAECAFRQVTRAARSGPVHKSRPLLLDLLWEVRYVGKVEV